MSPLYTPARMHNAPVSTGRAGVFAATIATTITTTTGTGTTGSGWVSVRE